jgi:hypothetical protein
LVDKPNSGESRMSKVDIVACATLSFNPHRLSIRLLFFPWVTHPRSPRLPPTAWTRTRQPCA